MYKARPLLPSDTSALGFGLSADQPRSVGVSIFGTSEPLDTLRITAEVLALDVEIVPRHFLSTAPSGTATHVQRICPFLSFFPKFIRPEFGYMIAYFLPV